MKEQIARRREAGFTLVEALVAIVVLVFGLIGVTNLLLVAGSSNSVANQSTAATAFASQQMDTLAAQSFSSLVAGGSVTSCNAPNYCRTDSVRGVGLIEVRWQITAIDANTLHIRVRATPQGVLGGSRGRAEFTMFRCRNAA